MKNLLLCCSALFLTSCSFFSFAGRNLDFQKAFPDRQFLMHEKDHDDPTSDAYWYLTDTTFDVAKEDFEKFLGKNWVGVQSSAEDNKELTKIVAKNDKTLLVEGSSIYISPKHPGRQVGLMQINKFPTTKLIFIYDDKP